jgi:beta-lactamase superfamily II metal-dependent hydrolase/fibronectin type 3 domain-containing protein
VGGRQGCRRSLAVSRPVFNSAIRTLIVALAFLTVAPMARGAVVISQVYAGGGSGTAGTAYTKDYVELFNNGGSSVVLTGHSLQYGSATGNLGGSASQIFAFTAGTTIPAGRYLLVALGAAGAAGAAVPSPDFTTTNLSMGAGAGKVALANVAAALGCGATATPCALPHASIVDIVAWGSSNNAEGGAPITSAAMNNTNGAIRNANGCTDTDNNNADFTVVTTGTGLVPRNSTSPVHSCVANAAPTITPPGDPITTVAQDAAPFTVGLTGNDDGGIYTWSATPGTGVTTVTVNAGQGTSSVTYEVTLTGGYSGTATFTATLTDGVNTPANQAVNIQVTPAPPAAPAGLTAVAGTSHVEVSWNSVGGATSYNVKRATVTGGPYTTIASPATNAHDDVTAVDGTQYFYVVSAVGPGGEGVDSAEVTATPMAAPTGLTPTPGNNQVGLAWSAVTGATSYDVKRATVTGGPYTTIASPASNAHTDSTAVNGTQYFYVVAAVNATGESINSAEVNATPAAPGKIVLSQVYAGGGSGTAGTAYTKDYVELFNSGGSAVDISGHSLQYGSATGNLGGSATQIFAIPPATIIPPGKYLLVALGAPGAAGAAVPSPDFSTTNLSMGAGAGKVALVINAVAIGCGATATPCALPHASILDIVAWGSSNNAEGGAPITSAALNSTNGSIRKVGGCTDTDNNNADFTVNTVGTGLVPRNSTSPVNNCGVNAPPTITPPADPIATVTQNDPPFPVGLTGSDDGATYTWSATPGTGVFSVSVTGGQGTANVTYTVTLVTGYSGTATFTATLTDGVNPPVNQAVNILVNLPPPPGAPTGLVATPGDSHVDLGWNPVPGSTSFNVKRATVSGGPYTTIVSPATNSHDDLTAVNGTTYYYVVSAVGPGGEGPDSTEVSATPAAAPTVPPAPANLVATPGDNTVGLAWDTTPTATSYNVKRATVLGGPYTPIATGIIPTTYNDNTAVNGTTYYYVVSGSNLQGEGADSNEASATPAPPPSGPTNLVAAVGNATVHLNWTTVAGATSYNVNRATVSGGPYTPVGTPATPPFNDNTVVNGTTYYYVVSAVVGSETDDSNEASATPNTPASLGMVISQLFGGGGNTSAPFQNDFIEVFNRGSQNVVVNGWSVQYASATGSTWTPTNLSGVIPAGRYFLVQEAAGSSCSTLPCGIPLPTPDASGAIAMAGGAGKVVLVAQTTALTGTCPASANIADLVGYGTTANCNETANAPAPSNTASDHRGNNGCTDTNNNSTDFATAAPAPRNSATPQNSCGFIAIGASNPTAVDAGQSSLLTVAVTPAAAPPSTGITVVADLTSIGGLASQPFFDDGTNGDVTLGDNTFSFNATVAPATTAGVKSLLATVSDAQARGTSASISLTVNPTLETIAAVKVDTTPADTVPDRAGQSVRVRGVVTSIDFRGGNGIEYYIQDPTGGIDVFNSSTNFGPFTVGDNIDVTGQLIQFSGLTEITAASITTLPGGTLPPVTPQTVTLSAINESLEGTLIRVNGLTIAPGVFAGDTNYAISDGSPGTMRVDADTNIVGTNAPTTTFSLIGVVGQFDNTNPFDTGYQIIPRSTADIIPLTSPTGVGGANPPSVPPGGTSLLTVTVTPGQNPASTGITVVADLSSIGLSASQTFFDNGTNGDVAPLDNIYSYSAIVDSGTALGPKTLPVQINDAETRSSATSINLNIQSASAPPTPTGLVATPGNAQVGLAWDTSVGATGYNVKRSTVSGGPYTTIANDIAPTSYNDTSVTNGVTYYYVVSALSGANESGDSNQASATPTAPPPAGPLAKIYFVDIGQGAGTLIVSPTGKSMLIDAGPNGQGSGKVIPLLNSLGITTLDYSLVTHYHIDHEAGMTEVISAGKLDNGIAYDNGDAPHVVPPVPTNGTGTAFTAYKNAITARGNVTRTTLIPGTVIDLGGGMTVTGMAQGGALLSGGNVFVSGTDINSSSVSVLVQYNNFDYLVSGDLTGGGSTTTAKTPDVESFVAQLAGDVEVVQLDHHGSTTANNRRFLAMLKAESSFASIGTSNTFGHPNREVVNRYLNTPVTSGLTYPGETAPNPGSSPIHYQTEASPPTDNRTSVQFHSGASAGNAGQGTLLLETDGLISYTMESFDDGGVRVNPSQHVYAIDGQGLGLQTNFPPTAIPYISPAVPTAADAVTVTALVHDREDALTSVTLNYSLNGALQAPVVMSPTVPNEYAGIIPAQPNGTRVEYSVVAVAGGATTTFPSGYFSGTTTIAALRSINALGEPTYLDYAARIIGTATSTTGNYSSTNNDDYMNDGTGALNVSRTIEPDVPATVNMTAGNNYEVMGLIGQLTGRLRLEVTPPFDGTTKPWDAAPGSFNPYTIIPAGVSSAVPTVKTIAQILADPEGHEAHLVSIANVTITSGTIPASGGLDTFLTINDGSGSMEMKIDSDGDIPGLATPVGTFTLVGIVQQDDFLRPFNTRYTIAPRDRTDLGAAAGGPALITIAEARIDEDPTTFESPDDFIPDLLGQQVKIRGVVTSTDFRGGSGTEIYIQDPTGGVDIFSTSINTTFNIGDNLEVVGTVAQFNGLTEIVPPGAPDITILAPGTLPPVNIEVVTLSQLANSGVGEAYEGKLIRINNVTLTAPPATFAANTNYNITDASGGPVQMRIDSDTNIDGTVPPASPFSVIGVLGQFDSAPNPKDDGYQLFPLSTSSFLAAVATPANLNATAGTPQQAEINTAFATQLQATVTDSGAAPIEGIGVTFTAPSTGASGTFANGTNVTSATTNASGVATATVFTANGITGIYNVVASTSSLTANFSLENTEAVDNSATHFDVIVPANVTAGVAFNVTVEARSATNVLDVDYTGTVTFTSSSAGTLPSDYTFTGADAGSHTFSVTLTDTGAQSVTATDTVTASITGTGNTTVGAAPAVATHFSVSAPANVTSGVAFNVTVTALDAAEATVTGYTGTVTFTSSSAGTLPANYTFTGADNGAHVFSVTLTSAGAQTVTATDTVTASITGTANTTVDEIPVLTINDINITEGDSGTTQATLTVTKTGTTSQNVSFDWNLVAGTATCCGSDFSGPDGSMTFQPNQTTKSINITVFGDIFFEGDETVFVNLSNAPGATIGDNQGVLTILNDDTPATHFEVTAPANVGTGVPFNVTVTALDSANAVTGYLGTVHFTSSSAGTLPADYTFVTADQGSHTFSVTLTTAGAQTITATDTVTASITGTANTTVDDIPVLTINDINFTEGNSGTTQATLTVTKTGTTSQNVAFDFNLVAGTASCCGVDFSGPDGSLTFLPNQTTKTINITVFGDIFFEADETVFVNLSNAPNATIGDPQGVLTILNDDTPATHFEVTAPANVVAGVPFNVTVTALDSANAVTGYLGTVHFTSSSAGTLPADYTFVVADNGTHTFSVTLTDTGAQSITATDTVTASINGSANVLVETVCPPPPPVTAIITADDTVCTGSTGNVATASATGATNFQWSIVNGTITSGQGTASITYTAGVSGNITLTVVTTNASGCEVATADSESVAISQLPTAALPPTIQACLGSTVDVTAELFGTAPFTVLWSDGVLQTNILTNQATRSITVNGDTVLSIDEISDASCTNDNPNAHVNIVAEELPVITDQTRHVRIASGNTVTLNVTTPTPNVTVEWFQGTFGDTSHPVGTDSTSYTTPALTRTTHYWFRLSNGCGTVDSQPITVTVAGRSRAVRH